MLISIKSKFIPNVPVPLLENIISNSCEDIDVYVERIIICDKDELENEIQQWDRTKTITKLDGCTVDGKTITYENKSIIFITTSVLANFYNNINLKDDVIIYNKESIDSLKTIYHEIGHAIRNHETGEIVINKTPNNYEDKLNNLWKILQDEFYAEMFCSNLIKLNISAEYLNNFSDDVETENCKYYLSKYQENGRKLEGSYLLQMIHQYYFVPLFQKAGLLEGLSHLISLENINVCQAIQDIQNCDVVNNNYVPLRFNEIVLRKWKEFNIEDQIISR